jgi:hypothetical protein
MNSILENSQLKKLENLKVKIILLKKLRMLLYYIIIPRSRLRSKIYEEKIHYAFFKLTQNIIHTFKFYHTEVENLEHLQHEIIVFLLSKIHLFNPHNGAKAYSYFGTIVKRWCILYNDKNYKSKIKKVSTDRIRTR